MSHSYLSAPLPCPSTTQNQQADRNLFKMLTCAGAATAQQARIPAQVWVQGGKCSVLWPWSLAEDECGGKKANSLGTSKGRCVCRIVSLLSPPSPWAHLPIQSPLTAFFPGTWAMFPHLPGAGLSPRGEGGPRHLHNPPVDLTALSSLLQIQLRPNQC